MNKKYIKEEEMISLVREIAEFASNVSFLAMMGSCAKPEEQASSPEDAAEKIRNSADEITESIKKIFSQSQNDLVRSTSELACNHIWDATALAITLIDASEEDDFDQE